MAITITRTQDLVTDECCACGILFAMPASFNKRKREAGGDFFCPNGHSLFYTQTENDRLKAEVGQLKQRLSASEEQTRVAREAKQKTERQISRLKKRTANGVCPCCTRSFVNLQRHMTTQHPDYAPA